MGVILALLSAVFYALMFFFAKILITKARNTLLIAALFQMLAGLLALPFFLLEPPFIKPAENAGFLLVVSIFLYALYSITNFVSNKMLDFSLTGILSQATVIITFIGSIILFRETATLLKFAGVLLIIIANIAVAVQKNGKYHANVKGILIRLLACLFLGAAILTDAKNSANFALPLYVLLTYFFPGIIVLFAARTNLQEIKEHIRQNYRGIMFMALVGFLGFYSLIKSFQMIDKSIAAPINNLSTIFMVVLGIVFLKEREKIGVKLLAVALVFIGVILLNLS